jgi:excinuclease ABC subunit B
MNFNLKSHYQPAGDQPQAIEQLVKGLQSQEAHQVLLGVTGSGKTFTMANVIAQLGRPTLVLSHNKTLAAQLYAEFKGFFPENAVEYFISYYDYYQPEAYIPTSNLYIEKSLNINSEIEKLRLATTSALLSGRSDIVVVASVSCIYGMGNPEEFARQVIPLKVGQRLAMHPFLHRLTDILYSRSTGEFRRGNFRVKGDTVDVFLAYADFGYRIVFWGDEVETITRFWPETGETIGPEQAITIFPANLFVTGKDGLHTAIRDIQDDLVSQIQFFQNEKKFEEADRIKERTELDLEMIRELGFCQGIENYSRYFDRRKPGDRPFCLLDFFPDDFLLMVDESHVTIPQIRAMWGGDRARKVNLVDYGFRLPSALDNRPLTFQEFESLIPRSIYVSATPGPFELQKTQGHVIEQIIRPTGLLDPEIDVRPTAHQIDDLLNEIKKTIEAGFRVLITTLTKRMAEELAEYLLGIGLATKYIHSEVKTLDRVEILRQLRVGQFDVLVGVNLLREGLDLPEVALVAIMDADKEGFLRNEKSLIQTIGRAARNSEGRVIMYADKITESMRAAIGETKRRRAKQIAYNQQHGITPKTIIKSTESVLQKTLSENTAKPTVEPQPIFELENDPVFAAMSLEEVASREKEARRAMEKASKSLDFGLAAKLRDEYLALLALREKKENQAKDKLKKAITLPN